MNTNAQPNYNNGSNGRHAVAEPFTLAHQYDRSFSVTPEYKATLPDMQNGPAALIEGSRVPIHQVGIHNFRLPLRFPTRDGEPVLLETAVTGTVSLAAHRKGINMSRIMRTFYDFQDRVFSLDMLAEILTRYREELDSLNGRLTLRFRYPMQKESLRSRLTGYQYYDVALEARMDQDGKVRRFIHMDFVYSSACPCSYELAQHAIQTRGVAAVSHSQRSVARVSVELNDFLWLEDLRQILLDALQTETQVMVKREDEQAFAELNGAYLKFVEDAVRLVYEKLDDNPRIRDFKVVASHQESLHSHDAISVIVKGISGGFTPEVEPGTMSTLIHR